ncbi:coactosin-like protein [Physella acuta]|uniref:coactosin-like protein n=1 Tax=Physella acuta TaxID=109671 RepID=UPI0027DDB2C0|nr:coactosin-like protein [Physella acuta]
MSTTIDKEAVNCAYEEVRDDNSPITWFTLHFNGTLIEIDSKGSDYQEFLSRFTDDERLFGYVRVTTGDEMSKRAKFAFITWAGKDVSPIKKAKLSVDKAVVKLVIKNFAVEILAEDQHDIALETVATALRKAGGANYGTGVSS